MNKLELTPNTVLLGERNYETALDLVIASAKNELLIFDQDLKLGDYASLKRFALINDFLSKNELSQLTIILQAPDYFMNHCSRLFGLLKLFGHKMTVYATNDAAKIAKDCFVIADKTSYLRRFHIDQARFKFAHDDENEVAALVMRFGELLDETTEALSPTTLGL